MSFNFPLVAKLWLIYVNLHIDYLSKVLHQDTRILYHYRTSSCWIVLNYPTKLNHLTNFKYKLRLKLNVKYGFFLRLPSRCTNCTFWNECNTIHYITLHTAHEEIAKNGWWLISLHYLADVVENRKLYCLADRCCIFTWCTLIKTSSRLSLTTPRWFRRLRCTWATTT